MLNHVFYKNPATFGDYILTLKKIVNSDDFIVINYRFLPKLRSIAANRTIDGLENRDKISHFEAILTTWMDNSTLYDIKM